jgi:lipopolysaccharide biosynthesis glycosyltransferase
MPRTIILSASDAKFFSFLEDLLASIEENAARDGITIGILDVGLTDDQTASLTKRGISVHKPSLHYDTSFFRTAPEAFFRAMTARPHLPRHFPGYDVYVFLDADCWVQDWAAVRLYITAAQAFDLAITPEVDRSYAVAFGQEPIADWRLNTFRRCFDEPVALNLARFPLINSGLFAARNDSPIWTKWSHLLGHLYHSIGEPFFFAEQCAMNALIRGQSVKAALLPSRCNWMCYLATPASRNEGRLLCEPQPPFEPLGIVHLAGPDKERVIELPDANGQRYTRTLRYQRTSKV